MSSYCGKICDECERKEELNCNGCKEWASGCSAECEIANCCKSKYHASCATCITINGCSKLSKKEHIPNLILNKRNRDEEEKAHMNKSAPILAKCFGIMFWLIVPQIIAGLLNIEGINYPTGIRIVSEIITLLCVLIYAFMLLKASKVNGEYKTAAICLIVGGILTQIAAIISITTNIGNVILLLTIPSAIVSLVGEYREFNTHADILEKFDSELSEKWRVLWKLTVISILCSLGGIVVCLIVPVLGLLVVLAGLILVIIVSIKKLIYLYKSAKIFKNYI